MLIVTPTGKTKLAMGLDTFNSFVTCFRVTGKVAALELVVKPTSWAGNIPFKKVFIPIRVKMRIRIG